MTKGKQEKRNGTQTEWTNGLPTGQNYNFHLNILIKGQVLRKLVPLFECKPSLRKKSGYPIIREGFSLTSWDGVDGYVPFQVNPGHRNHYS